MTRPFKVRPLGNVTYRHGIPKRYRCSEPECGRADAVYPEHPGSDCYPLPPGWSERDGKVYCGTHSKEE